MIGRALVPHAVLLVLAAGASVYVWTREKKTPVAVTETTVWSGRPEDVDRVAFESKTKKVTLESKKDAAGRYFVGTSETHPAATDAGPPAPPKTVKLVSVGAANKLAEALAPLKALREVGKIGPDRAAEFGLKEPDGKLTVTLAGKDRTLSVGARTPGGGDRYVEDDASGAVYVVSGDATRDLESGEGALSERELHDMKDEDIESVRIVARDKVRTVLRRGPESKRIWSDPADPEKADETASNWISKVDRLRPSEYLADPPGAPEVVVRVEYKVKGGKPAFVEVAKVPAPPPEASNASASTPPKSDYLVRSERTRLWAKTFAQVGEQVEQDLGSVLK